MCTVKLLGIDEIYIDGVEYNILNEGIILESEYGKLFIYNHHINSYFEYSNKDLLISIRCTKKQFKELRFFIEELLGVI